MNYTVILLAAGTGSRMNLGFNKMLMTINHKPLITLTASTFFNDLDCKQLIYVTNPKEMDEIKSILNTYDLWDNRCSIVAGGEERQHSVFNGISCANESICLIHDGARPFVTKSMINELVKQANIYGSAIPAVKVKDTIKLVHNQFVTETLPRQHLVAVQTPQACNTSLLLDAHAQANEEKYLGTDDASLIERYTTQRVCIVEGSYNNIKLTTKEDISIAEKILNSDFMNQ